MSMERHRGKRLAPTGTWTRAQLPSNARGNGKISREMAPQSILGSPANKPYFSNFVLKQSQALEPASVDGGSGVPKATSVFWQPEGTPTIPPLAQNSTLEIKSEESPQWLRLRFLPLCQDQGSKSKLNWLGGYIKKCDVWGIPYIRIESILNCVSISQYLQSLVPSKSL